MENENIEQILNQHRNEIDTLKSNTKWLYKYGGIGSKYGGSSSGTDTSFSIYCEFDNISIANNGKRDSSNGKHTLKVKINKHNGLTYSVSGVILNSSESTVLSRLNPSRKILSFETTYTAEYSITLTENSVINITVDGPTDTQSFKFSITTTPYQFELAYINNEGDKYGVSSMENSELFINTLALNGFKIQLSYLIGIDAEINYITSSSLPELNNLEGSITNYSGNIIFDIDSSLLRPENTGQYSFRINLSIKKPGELPYVYPLSCSFFLIPSDLFLLLYTENSDNKIYYSSDGQEPMTTEGLPFSSYFDEFNELNEIENKTEEQQERFDYITSQISFIKNGIVGLVGKVYYGQNANRTFVLQNDDGSSINIYNNDSEEPNRINFNFTTIIEQKVFNCAPYIDGINKNRMVLTVSDNRNRKVTFNYYMYTYKEKNALSWYDKNELSIDTENYWRNGLCSYAFNSTLNGLSTIESYSNNETPIILTNSIQTPQSSEGKDVLISLGIQYSSINNDDNQILKITDNNDRAFDIYQNRIDFNGVSCTIYIPKELSYNALDNNKYHLLQISQRKIINNKYQILVYIDGILESAFVGYVEFISSFTSIELLKSNVALNLIDLTYSSNNTQKRQLGESDISKYWYNYCFTYNKENILYDDNSLDLISIFDKLGCNDEHENIYRLAYEDIERISKYIDTPVLLLNASATTNLSVLAQFGGSIMSWFTSVANSNTAQIRLESISWSPGKSELVEYNLSKYQKTQGFYWYIEPQGSSTLNRRVKNLNLGISTINTVNSNVILFTPNFKKVTNTMTEIEKQKIGNSAFLPEQQFTLKADIVDSTHCNNVSIGKFVNTVTSKFTDAQQLDSKYNIYIKNCLTGFPMLVFLKFEKGDDVEFYYLGIYNFNLGRKSYFNLGYNSFTGLESIVNCINEEASNEIDEGFGIYEIDPSGNQHLSSLLVTEIQSGSLQNQTHEGGGGNVYDFSQFHNSVLFGTTKFPAGMYGDFEISSALSGLHYGILQSFTKSIAKAGAYIFMKLKKNIDNDILISNLPVGDYDIGYSRSKANDRYVSLNHIPDFLLEAYRDESKNGDPIYFRKPDDANYTGIMNDVPNFDYRNYSATRELLDALSENPNVQDWLIDAIVPIRDDDQENQTIVPVSIDYTSLVYYYVICMAMGLVDSVCKNLNLKSWKATSSGVTKMYTAFYDMDTALGRDNFGKAVSYFAFSDYWKENNTIYDTETLMPDKITIYRDFYPTVTSNEEAGYDIPTSYLFAIAKYAKLFVDPNLWEINQFMSPTDIWFDLRNPLTGQLRNAKYFIDTYFHNDIKNIPEILINYNYRFKYLWNDTSNNNFIDTEIGSFHGLGIYSLHDWLANRLHILDLYFNLCNSSDILQYYDEQNDEWKNIDNTLTEIIPASTSGTIRDFSIFFPEASDVIIYKNAFADQSTQYIKSSIEQISFDIKTPELSPFVVISDPATTNKMINRYLLNDPNIKHRIIFTNKGSQETIIGASILWTAIYEAGYFINSSQLSCYSDSLEYLKSTIGSCNSYNLNTPSLHTLILNSEKYTGNLSIGGSSNEEKKLPNLNLLNIDSCKFTTVEIRNTNIQYIYIRNAEIERLQIYDCKNIKRIDLSNSIINKIQIQYPWTIDDKILDLSNTSFTELNLFDSIANTDQIMEEFILSNGSEITTLNVKNTKKLSLNKFTKLSTLYMTNDIVETLILTNSKLENLTNSDNSIYVDESGTLHLEKLTNLKRISFEGTLGFTKIILPYNDIELLCKAFLDTDLYYIDYVGNVTNIENPKYLILCDNGLSDSGNDCSIFANSCFTLSSSDNTILHFKVKEKNTTLVGLFKQSKYVNAIGHHNGISNITYNKAAQFLNNLVNKNYVTSLANVFYLQTSISATYNPLTYSYTCSGAPLTTFINMDEYVNVSSIEGIFNETDINFINNTFFSGSFAQNVDTINILNCFNANKVKYIEIDAFDSIKGKYTQFLFDGISENNIERFAQFVVYGDEVSSNELLLRRFLFNDNKSKLTRLCGFNILNKVSNFDGLFTSNEDGITEIYNVFNNLSQLDIDYVSSTYTQVKNINNMGLSNLTNLNRISKSIICESSKKQGYDDVLDDELVDMLNFIDYHHQYENIMSTDDSNIFNFYKKIDLTTEDNMAIWETLWSKINVPYIGYTFSKCRFIMPQDNNVLTIPDKTLNKVNSAIGLFANSTCYVNGEEVGIKIDSNSFKKLSNVKNVSSMFSGSTLNGIDAYPIPVNLFTEQFVSAIYANSMFLGTNIIGAHKTYYDALYQKDIYYKKFLLPNVSYQGTYNYTLDDELYSIGNDNSTVITTGYPIIPPQLFKSTSITSIVNMFDSSDFEGYLPYDLLMDSNIKDITGFITNCKVLPQKVNDTKIVSDNIYNCGSGIDAYVFIPSYFLNNVERIKVTTLSNLFTFNILVSDISNIRIYIFTNESINWKKYIIDNIALNYPESSLVIHRYIRNDADGSYDTSENNFTGFMPYINLCIGKDSSNKYYEGLDLVTFRNKVASGACLINEKLIVLYYGYIFKKGTAIHGPISDILNTKRIMVSAGIIEQNPSKVGERHNFMISDNAIFPSIYVYSRILAADTLPTQLYTAGITKLDDLGNTKYIPALLTISQVGQTISQNNIDKTWISNAQISYTIDDPIFDNSISQYIYKVRYTLTYHDEDEYSYNIDYDYKSNVEVDKSTITEANLSTAGISLDKFKSDIYNICYYNYLLLFNAWQRDNINGDKVHISLYNSLKVSGISYVYCEDGSKLNSIYQITLINVDDTYRIQNIQAV